MQDVQVAAEGVEFKVNGINSEKVDKFYYLRRVLTAADNGTPCIEDRSEKARIQWKCFDKIIKQDGGSAKTMATFYIATVQAVLLYGAYTWAAKGAVLRK